MNASKIIVWKRPDNTLLFTSLNLRAKRPSESETDFANRMITTIKSRRPIYNSYTANIKNLSELRGIEGNGNRNNNDKIRLNSSGNLFIDNSIVTKTELFNQRKNALRTKLLALGLTNDEVKLLFQE